ncbi:MAG TPA: hypothetical protein VKE22_11155 [Haliangiales bacterium]|nr:hypothetical protein [Haliangiales bacterium]
MAGLALSAVPARAQVSDTAEERALELNRRSAELYRQGNYAEAAALLREAYRLRPEPVLQYNLARACEMMADYACAVGAYESYLASRPADRAAVEAKLAAARAQLAARPPTPPPAETPARGRSLLPPIVTAAGAVGLGVGITLVLIARGRHDDAVADPTQRGAMDKQQSAESLMTGANVVLVASGVVAAAGAVWWIVDAVAKRPEPAPPPAASLQVGPGWIGVAGRF